MFSSFLQYLCFFPCFTNVLKVYAFCNLHEVSSSTEGCNKTETLPSVSSFKTKDTEVTIEDTAKFQEDIDGAFKETVTRAITRITVKTVPEKPNMHDQNKIFRTRLLTFWMLSNAVLAVTVENIDGIEMANLGTDDADKHRKQDFCIAIVLYSMFALALVRFAGVSRFTAPFILTEANPPQFRSVCSTFSTAIFSDGVGGIDAVVFYVSMCHTLLISPDLFRSMGE